MNFLDPRLPDLFWSRCIPEPNSGCWLWIGYVRPDGYGVLNVNNSIKRAHRLSYAALVGPLDVDLVIDHRCRVRSCCNPAHLEQVTDKVNVSQRGNSIAAMRARQTSCVNGHVFTPENTFTRPQRPGTRECRDCQTARNRARYKRTA